MDPAPEATEPPLEEQEEQEAQLDEEPPPEEEDPLTFFGTITGTYQIRLMGMSDLQLTPLDGEPERMAATETLGQNYWAEQWIRLDATIGLRSRVTLTGQLDVLDGVVLGDLTTGVGQARHARAEYDAFTGLEPRALYVDWLSPVGLVRAGLVPSHWGLGILANDGAHDPVFGDPRFGDKSLRLLFATRPLGASSPYTVAVAGDLVYDDVTAELTEGDTALQAVLAAYYERRERFAGVYLVYRHQEQEDGDTLEVFAADAHVRWDVRDPLNGRLFAALEGALIFGETTFAHTTARPRHDVLQLMAAAQLGRHHDRADWIVEIGYTSGDSNTQDDLQGRATMDPDHRIGLILFPEMLAWSTARAATRAADLEVVGREAPGSELLSTNGGVAGAIYLFPHGIWRPRRWLELRIGAVWARASSDVIDPVRQARDSRNAAWRGGRASSRDLGFEVDGSVLFRADISTGVSIDGGLEAGLLIPGHAFDDEAGNPADPVGLVRLRAGLRF